MKYNLKDLVDLQKLQELTDNLYDAAGIPSAIITMDGEILTGSGWQRICTDFHRKHPEIEKDCIESDISIHNEIEAGEPFSMYTCPRGLTDASVPIVIEGEHIANAFAGQLFLEEPGKEVEQQFRQQARHFGMDEEAYMEAFREIPVMSIDRFRASLKFLAKLATMIADMGLQRKREVEAEAELRTNEEKYRTLFETMSQGVFYQRADGSLIDCNAACLEMFGITRDQFLGRNSMHPDWKVLAEDGTELPGDQHPSMRALRTGKPAVDTTVAVYHPERKSLVWLIINATPQFHPGEKKPYQVFVTMHDITERKQAEEALLKSEEKLRNVLEATPFPVAIVDENDDKIHYWSQSALDIFGHTAPTAQEWYEIAYPDPEYRAEVIRRWRPFLEQARKSGKPVNTGEYNITCADGSQRVCELYATFVSNQLIVTFNDITERKLAEVELLKKESFLAKAQEIGSIGTWELDIQQNELHWTDENYRIFGLPIGSKLTYEIFLNCVHPDDREYVDRRWKAVFDRRPYDIEHRLLVDGKVKWVREKAELEFNDQDQCIRGIGVTQDITYRKKTEEALAESEERYSLAMRASQDGLFDWNLVTNDIYYSPGWKRMLGYEDSELPNEFSVWEKLTEPESVRKSWEMLDELFKKKRDRFEMEFKMLHKDGHWVDILSRADATFDESGKAVRVVGIHVDISDRKQYELELLNRKQILDATGMMAKIGGWEHDLLTGKAFWTKSLYDIIEIPYDEEPPNTSEHLDFYPPDDRKIITKAYKKTIKDGTPFDIELQGYTASKRLLWFRVQGEPIYRQGKCVGLRGALQDITERKLAEKEKAHLEKQLHQSQKMESIGRLAGGVAHDFNNLLTVITGFSELVQESLAPDDPLKKDVAEIQMATESATNLTNQLLAFSRKQIVSPKVLNLNKEIIRSERMLRRIIGEDIEFTFMPDESIRMILIDPGQLDQVLVNLGVNSRDAMPDGGKLTIEVQNVSLDEKKCQTCGKPVKGDFVVLAVSDNGTGMDTETIKSIFEPFYTTKEKGKGTGLGLSTVHGIVLQNNGHISVYSEPGCGSTFKIYLPVADENAEPLDKEVKNIDIAGSETILLVEDLETLRKLAVKTLTRHGYKVIQAENGRDALTKYEKLEGKIDLLVTDVVMPQMNGKQLYDRLLEINPNLKALFMSGYPEDAVGHHGILDQGTNFVQKPFHPRDLAIKVRQVLEAKNINDKK